MARAPCTALLGAGLFALCSMACIAQSLAQTRADYLRAFDANGDGRVSQAEYVRYLSAGFHALDRNGDGILQSSELPGGHGRALTRAEREHDLRQQFRRLDRNHDHYLDANELTAPPR
jgi:Ca2+-binding EF-hand superfamily protein